MTHLDLRNEILLTVRAGRELPADHDEQLADHLAERFDEAVRAMDAAQPGHGHRAPTVPRAQMAASAASAVFGFGGLAYAYHQLSTAASIFHVLPGPDGQHALDVASPFLLIVAVALIAHVGGTYVSTVRGNGNAYRLSVGATIVLLLAGIVAVSYTGTGPVAVMFDLFLPSAVVVGFTLATVFFAVVACVLGGYHRHHQEVHQSCVSTL